METVNRIYVREDQEKMYHKRGYKTIREFYDGMGRLLIVMEWRPASVSPGITISREVMPSAPYPPLLGAKFRN